MIHNSKLEFKTSFAKLNSYDLKVLALITMLIDHIGFIFFPEFTLFRVVGRTSFILYSFMLVEGFFLTKNLRRYFLKSLLWAFLSEIPFDLAFHKKFFYWQSQNIFFLLVIGVAGMYFISKQSSSILKLLIALICVVLVIFLRIDYSWYGIFTILVFYYYRNQIKEKFLLNEALAILASFKILSVQFFAFLGFIPIVFYNGEHGKKVGNIYYSFYAMHLLIFALLKYLID